MVSDSVKTIMDAESRAENTVKSANLDAERIIKDAKDKAESIINKAINEANCEVELDIKKALENAEQIKEDGEVAAKTRVQTLKEDIADKRQAAFDLALKCFLE